MKIYNCAGVVFLLILISVGCANTPKKKVCTELYKSPNLAAAHEFKSTEDRFSEFQKECEPEYQLDKEAFLKADSEGRKQNKIAQLKVFCGCSRGFLDATRFDYNRQKHPINVATTDPLYNCDSPDGKSEFMRGLLLGEKFAKDNKLSKWTSFREPNEAESVKACLK